MILPCLPTSLADFTSRQNFYHALVVMQWHPTPAFLPGKSHGWRSLVGCSPWGCKESDKTEWLPFPFSLSCIGEGNGNPLQCSCLENPRDRGAWWTAIYGVAQSQTRLKQLSSSSSSDAMRPSVGKKKKKKQRQKTAPTAWWTLMQYRILPRRACCFWVWFM